MDSGAVIVLVLTLAGVVFLVFAEKNSRRNEAKLKAEVAAKAAHSDQASASAGKQEQKRVGKKDS